MSGWTQTKYALALIGVALVLAGGPLGRPYLGWLGLGLLVVAFVLRFLRSAKDPRRKESAPLP